MRFLFTIETVLLASLASGQSQLLQDSPLIVGAHEVIISEETHFEIKDIDQSSLSTKYTTCILDKYACNTNNLIVYYDDFSEIRHARVTVLDQNLKEVKSYKLKDFDDYSANGSSMATDSRAKVLGIKQRTYPYYIEVEYVVDYEGSLHYPRWLAQEDEKIAVLSSSLTVESFLENPFRFHANISAKDSLVETNHFKYTWQVDSLPAFTWKNYSYNASDYTPYILLAPSDFQMDGIIGDLRTWQSFGFWVNTLNRNQNTLTEIEKEEIKKLVHPDDSKLEKTKKIYKYLQENTRYVSIQLGIGGWKPFETGFVHNYKYGDCKALSFYTLSMLKEVGVDAYYTLISAGRSTTKTVANFPSAHFNHAILTVPTEIDTIWLECTSQDNPFGYIGTFTSDRPALLVDGEQSKIIHTRNYDARENLQDTRVELSVNKDGVGEGVFQRNYSGIEIENDGFVRIIDKSEREKNEWFMDNHDWGNLAVSNLSISDLKGSVVPKASVSATIEIQNAASKMGKRMFFSPFKFTNIDYMTLKDNEREVPLEIRYAYSQKDTMSVQFEEGFYPERQISPMELTSEFGSYSIEVIQEQNRYFFIRSFTLEKGKYVPSQYLDFKAFIEKVQRSDRQKLVLINRT